MVVPPPPVVNMPLIGPAPPNPIRTEEDLLLLDRYVRKLKSLSKEYSESISTNDLRAWNAYLAEQNILIASRRLVGGVDVPGQLTIAQMQAAVINGINAACAENGAIARAIDNGITAACAENGTITRAIDNGITAACAENGSIGRLFAVTSRNSLLQLENSRALTDTDILVPLLTRQNVAPPGIPENFTRGTVRNANSREINIYLAEYGLPRNGNLLDRKNRLLQFLGSQRL